VVDKTSLKDDIDAILSGNKPPPSPADPTPAPEATPDPTVNQDIDPAVVAILDQIKGCFSKMDFDKIADLMYPPVVADEGGKQAVTKALQNEYAKPSAAAGDITFSYDAPGQLFAGLSKDYLFITTHTTTTTQGHRSRTDSFLLFIREHGESAWTFIDGEDLDSKAPLTSEIRDRRLADLPSEIKFQDTVCHSLDR
jgi:hypothetical protein